MTTQTTGSRHSWGADEHLFVEVAEEMSLEAYFRSMAIVTAVPPVLALGTRSRLYN